MNCDFEMEDTMDVLLQLELNEEEERGFKDLILLCNKEDETDYDTGLDYDFFYSIRNEEKKESGLKEEYLAILMGYKLGEQEEGKDILLCTAFVHPGMRGQGLFTCCMEALYDDFRGIKIRLMRKGEEEFFLHFPYLYSEYFLEKNLEHPIAFPGERRRYPYGEVYFSAYNEKTLYLYGLMVENRFRRQGRGEEILRDCLEKGESGQYEKVILQVDSRNKPAMQLYMKMGFTIQDSLAYYSVERKRKKDGKDI